MTGVSRLVDILWTGTLIAGFIAAISVLMVTVSLSLATVLNWRDKRPATERARARQDAEDRAARVAAYRRLERETNAIQQQALGADKFSELDREWLADLGVAW